MSDEEFAKTQYCGFFKPAVGTMNWGTLSSANWDMVDAFLQRHHEMIAHLHGLVDLQRKELLRLGSLIEPEEPHDDD